MKYALFIGRWQPFHLGHKFIIDKALDKGESVCVGVRDTPISEWDPYTVEQRIDMIKKVYPQDNVIAISMPDISSVNIGRKVGYDVNRFEAPANITNISATQIRQGIEDGDDSWKTSVPVELIPTLEKINE